MALGLTVTDTEDGTGGTAAVTGSAVGSTNNLYRAVWTGVPGTSLSWTLAATRTGNGSLALTGTGSYAWLLVNVAAGVTTLGPQVYQPLTDTAASCDHKAILDAVKTRILALALSGVSSVMVLERWVPRVYQGVEAPLPAVFISPAGNEEFPPTTLQQDDVGFPVLVVTADKGNFDNTANLNRDLKWRDQIGRAVRSQRLAGCPKVWNVKQYPSPVIDPGAIEQGYLVGALLFRAFIRQTRGIT